MNSKWIVVFSKEFIDNLRDKRALTTAAVSALLGPVMALFMIVLLGQLLAVEKFEPLELAVQGAENGKSLVAYLEQHYVNILPAPENPTAAVKAGDPGMVLVIPPEYGETFEKGQPAKIQVIVDTTRTSSQAPFSRLKGLLSGYSGQIGSLRLMLRGVNPQTSSALTIETVDLATPQSRSVMFLLMLPMFLIMSVFLGGMAVAIDATAGERERSSLEPLLMNPVSRAQLVTGKLCAAMTFALGSVILALAGFGVIFNVFPIDDFIDFPMVLTFGSLIGIFIVTIPLIPFAGALQMIIAGYTKSYKEAQNTVAWLPIVPLLPGMAAAYLSVKSHIWAMLVPTLGQQLLILELLRGEQIAVFKVLIASLITLAISGMLLWIAIRRFSRENLLFNA